jgi:hypothetical protein
LDVACFVCHTQLTLIDMVIAKDGLAHRRCVSIESLSTEWVPQNDHDPHGWPICPTCNEALKPGESAAREGAYMVHPGCLRR